MGEKMRFFSLSLSEQSTAAMMQKVEHVLDVKTEEKALEIT